jgi:hypothetical protein
MDTELRMMALGLPITTATHIPANPRRAGRPRALPMLERINVAIAWGTYMNAHARLEAPRERGQVKKLQQKLEAGRMNGVAPFLLNRMSARLDRLGRASRTLLLPPAITLPEADRAIAKQFGISERMVRKIRSDRRMQPFMPHPVWQVRDWERRGAESHAARARAKQLMTPERYAKNERVALLSDGLAVEQDPTSEAVYKAAWRIFRLLQRLEKRMPPQYRRRPAWLGFQRQWARMEARCEGWFFLNDQQVYFWKRHPEGRRVPPKIQDYDRKVIK